MKGSLEVLDGGLQTTVQDAGRVGYRKYGVPVSGVMDVHAYQLANWLVGNKSVAPVLELTLKGGTFKFHSDAKIGISGGHAEVLINEKPAPSNKTIKVYKDDLLNIGKVRSGCRVYLAIAGEWSIAKVMGSYSTCLIAKFGGFEGRALRKGDRLTWNSSKKSVEIRTIPKELIPHYAIRQTIHIIKGPEWNWLDEAQQAEFLAADFSLSSESNRMGIR
ncbi:MAG TPA: biotin-dependent carboxyltransferase family protein, partial [Gracilimonas sp.]|uniref:5-oxoprolinase subunit C family protein n=1 Tax=Gracilimonas sp. TaxID=1974203 RepID=UPI002D986B08|nr:biotin-dependent carboxyltransferase family protein [Gracilimonas sp.]